LGLRPLLSTGVAGPFRFDRGVPPLVPPPSWALALDAASPGVPPPPLEPALEGLLPPINVIFSLSIEASNSAAIPLH
jgi:hypothetical protein